MDEVTSDLVVLGNRRGRPRVAEPRTHVSTWLPESEADQIARIAHRNDMSVSKVVRQLIRISLRNK